jgi:hypothetical protein
MKNLASRLALLAIAVTSLQSAALASPSEKPVFVWLAASSSRPIVSNQLGRLSIKDDVLSFDGSAHDWRVTLDDVRLVTVSPESDKLLLIETVRGEKYYVAILSSNMLVEKAGRTASMIRRAQRGPATRR